ncbi:MAG: cyclodeaminase/cyclohydrolase family protein [Desulfosoma sp.]
MPLLYDDAFLEVLRQPRPDPGGGSAAAHGALMALCLLEKVIALEKKRASGATASDLWWEERRREINSMAHELFWYRKHDVEVYKNLAATRKSQHSLSARDSAAEAASQVPLNVMKAAAAALETSEAVGARCARHLTADVAVAVEFLGSAVQGAFWIGLANAQLVENAKRRETLIQTLLKHREKGEERLRHVREILKDRNETGGR